VSDYAKEPAVDVTLDFTADKILLDPFLAGGDQQKPQAAPAAADAPEVEPGPLELPVTAKGSGKIGALVYRGLTVSDLDVRFTLARNVLTVSTFSGRMAQGSFSVSKRVDLGRRGFAYEAEVKVRQVQANPLIAAFYPVAAGTVAGELDLDLNLQGAGTTTAALQRNLSGAGRFALQEAQLSGAGLAQGLAVFFQEDELRLLKFTSLAADFRISNGQVSVEGDFSGSRISLKPTGTIGLDGGLNLLLPTRLAPELGRKLGGKSNLVGALRDSEGWTVVPLRAKGSLTEPKLTLDSRGAREAVGAKLQEQLERSLDKRLRKSAGDSAATGEGKKGSEELKDALKGILGR
jgi:AsmA protein